jgi:hypothetical protein
MASQAVEGGCLTSNTPTVAIISKAGSPKMQQEYRKSVSKAKYVTKKAATDHPAPCGC